jgi:hypothetical protein
MIQLFSKVNELLNKNVQLLLIIIVLLVILIEERFFINSEVYIITSKVLFGAVLVYIIIISTELVSRSQLAKAHKRLKKKK